MSAAKIKITIELEYKSGVRKLSESLVIPEEWSHMEADNMGTVEWQRVVDLTQIMDRRNGKDRLAELIELARQEQKMLTVVFYDINGLHLINDTYGHHEGDNLLLYVSKIIEEGLTEPDLLFRLSEDEFILALYDETEDGAAERMEKALELLEKKREQFGIYYDASFCYGVTAVYPSDKFSVNEIITRADERMYIQKRNFRIDRAGMRLRRNTERGRTAPGFDYNREFLYEALASSTDDYVFIGDMKTGIFRYPAAMVEEFGLPGEIVENAAAVWGVLIHPEDKKGFLESNQDIADGRVEHHNIEYRARNVFGEWCWLRCRGRMVRDNEGKPEYFAGFITNMGKKNLIDHRTGLYNRYELEGTVKKHLVDDGRKFGLMILDMDEFKNVNDLYDRSFGDEVLRVTAQMISSLLPSNARMYRLDGDEFAILILNGDWDEHIQIFNRIRYKMHRQQEFEGKKYYCTVSAGYAAFPEDGSQYLELVKCANYSLEHSKLLGKDRITCFSPDILPEKERRLELMELLRESIEHGFAGFSVAYRPQVEAATGKLFGAEALARWTCGKYGSISPGEFIPLLERSGLINQLGRWIFSQAAAQCGKWRRYRPDFRMSINVSYHQLRKGDIVPDMLKKLEQFAMPPSSLTLELTESYFMKEEESRENVLDKLHGAGFTLAMDDFGMGYSSLLSLKNIPVDVVKIDRGFVKGITEDRFNAIFIGAITELCHNVGKQVCLEGVETEEEYRAVRDTGLELIQGFYFGLPVAAEEFERQWLSREL